MTIRRAIFITTAMAISAYASAQIANSETQDAPLSFNIESEQVVNGTQYTTIAINWNANQTQHRLQDAKVMAYDAETNKPLSEVSGWAFMENKPQAIHDESQVGIIKSDREKTVYLLSDVTGDLPVCFSVQGNDFSYDSCANKQSLQVQSIAKVEAEEVNTIPYVIKSANFVWDYKSIFANNKHQLKFYVDIVATSCFDKADGNPQEVGQCDDAPDLSQWEIPLSDAPELQTFNFRKIVNSQASDLIHFNKTYEAEGIYLKQAPPQLTKMAELPTQKTTEELPPYEKLKRYTFYLTANQVTDLPVNLCVELDEMDEVKPGTENFPSFRYSNCSSPNSENNISAISSREMPLVINGQTENTYSVSFERTETDKVECDDHKLGVSGHLIGLNVKETGYIENVPTAFYFNKDIPYLTMIRLENNIFCKNYNPGIDMDRSFVKTLDFHLSRVTSDYTDDPYRRNNGLASVSQVSEYDLELSNVATIFGAYEDELDGTAAAGAIKFSRDTLAEYTSLDGPSVWQTHLLTVRWVHDDNDTPTKFVYPNIGSTTRPSGNSHNYYITDSFGNQSAQNLTYDDTVNYLIDGYDDTIPLF
ncbi:hypothetical protein GXP65_24095 [Vibrio campbellii]|uniref:hypothetical protein n=1 Tax=Vibrio sp. LB10LO1 TaxID=2711207 RepID=UPI0013895486|nr:hypothetical protein [Vibrio sp. LB10LO1]NDJ84118.1 hypothetical protein [Vibrio sp. LB10LO1]